MALTDDEELELLQLEEEEYQNSLKNNPDTSIKGQSENKNFFPALGKGLSEGLTAGYSDEIGAKIQEAADLFLNKGKIAQANREFGQPGVYEQAYNENKAEREQLENEMPTLMKASELAGSLAIPIPGSSLKAGAAGVKTLGQIAKGAGKVALEQGLKGGAQNALYSSGKAEDGDRLSEALKGFGSGFAAGGVLGGGAAGTADLARKVQNKIAFSRLNPSKSDLVSGSNILMNPTQKEELGNLVLNEGIDKFSTNKAYNKISDVFTNKEDEINNLINAQSANQSVLPTAGSSISDTFLENILGKNKEATKRFTSDEVNKILSEADVLGKTDIGSIKNLDKITKDLGARTKSFGNEMGIDPITKNISEESWKANRNALSSLMEGTNFNQLKKEESDLFKIKDMLANKYGAEGSHISTNGRTNLTPHPSDVLGNISDSAKWGANRLVGGANIMANKTMQGAQRAGIVSNIVSRPSVKERLQNNPESLGKYADILNKKAQEGDSALSTTDYVLQNIDPEYRKLISGENE